MTISQATLRRLERLEKRLPVVDFGTPLPTSTPDQMRVVLKMLIEIGWFEPTYLPGTPAEAEKRRYFAQLLWPDYYETWEADCALAAQASKEREQSDG